MNGFNGKTERAWCKLASSTGEIEVHLEGERWQVWARTDRSDDLVLVGHGGLDGAGPGGVPLVGPPKTIQASGLSLNPTTREVTYNGEPVPQLANKEYALLAVLMREPRRVFTREELLRDVWDARSTSTRTLDSHASRLRRKLERAGGRFVINCWGIGYRLI